MFPPIVHICTRLRCKGPIASFPLTWVPGSSSDVYSLEVLSCGIDVNECLLAPIFVYSRAFNSSPLVLLLEVNGLL